MPLSRTCKNQGSQRKPEICIDEAAAYSYCQCIFLDSLQIAEVYTTVTPHRTDLVVDWTPSVFERDVRREIGSSL